METKQVNKKTKGACMDHVVLGHTLIKRINSTLYTHSLKLVVGIPSQEKEDNCPEGNIWTVKSLGY